MTITIPHPRLLLLLVALVIAGGVTFAALADDPSAEPPLEIIPIGNRQLPTVSPEDSATARAVLERDARVLKVLGDRGWRIAQELPESDPDWPKMVTFIIAFETPFDSDGPWLTWTCQGTVPFDGSYEVRSIKSLAVVINPVTRAVRSVQPLEADFSQSPSWQVDCPKGKEDNN
ncbi:MAG: hypothetical protein ACKVVT_03365 [Dehalococcoidia bacterium]